MTEKQNSILSERKSKVPLSKKEVIFMLRAYHSHPASWIDIIEEVQDNLDHLPPRAKELYRSASVKQLRDRLSGKLNKLLSSDSDEDDDIRMEVQKIRRLEARNTSPGKRQHSPVPSLSRPIYQQISTAGPSQPMPERRDNLTEAMPFEIDHQEYFEPPKKVLRKEKKLQKKLKRKNKNNYMKFFTKTVPKLLLKTLGVSTSSSDSDSDD